MAANKLIAFATCRPFPALAEDDVQLATALTAVGYTVEAAPWDDAAIDWTKYRAVIIRSTWNYHLHPAAFRTWLHRLKKLGLSLFNPANILEWNMDKSYLSALQQRGVPLPPTQFLDKDSQPDLDSIFRTTGWQRAVIKPCISATAYNTWVTRPDTVTADNPRLHELLRTDRYIIQEFMEEVKKEGEYSLLFFGQQYSHAVKKTARADDFRVQERYGGISLPTQPASDIIRQATAILDKAVPFIGESAGFDGSASGGPSLLYARVDGVIRRGVFTLMELELVEPTLFFDQHPLAVQQFVYFFNSSLTAASIC
ncbi:MAG TPA: hypothetical protein VHC96_15055 [Puia sp.]|nr:hypothetical protein [Puia sp.]